MKIELTIPEIDRISDALEMYANHFNSESMTSARQKCVELRAKIVKASHESPPTGDTDG